MMANEPILGLQKQNTSISRILDLGGGSGTFYNKNLITDMFEKDTEAKEFMKSDELKPNNFSDDIDAFVEKFNEAYSSM